MELHLRNQRRQVSSSLEPKTQEFTSTMMEQRDYYIFHNVALLVRHISPDQYTASLCQI